MQVQNRKQSAFLSELNSFRQAPKQSV